MIMGSEVAGWWL